MRKATSRKKISHVHWTEMSEIHFALQKCLSVCMPPEWVYKITRKDVKLLSMPV